MSDSAENNNLIPMTCVGENLYGAERKKSISIFIRTVIIGLCVIFILFSEALFVTLYTGIYIVDGSMSPTLTGADSPNVRGGDYIYINTHVKPDYGDIVVVYNPHSTASGIDKLIKRVVAFGGDTVKIEAGVLYVNGERRDESYISSEYNKPNLGKNNYHEADGKAHTVKEGCMFLLGDNRNESNDSREFGDVPIENLVGVVPNWSMRTKNISTAVYTYFHFTIFGK